MNPSVNSGGDRDKSSAESAEVKQLQRNLRALGFFQAGIDGVFGPKTKKAVVDFQLEKGIITNASEANAGTVTAGTRLAIKAALEGGHGGNGSGGERVREATVPQKITKLPQIIGILDANPNIEVVSLDLVNTLIYSRSGYFGRREKYFKKAAAILRRNGISVSDTEFRDIRGYQTREHEKVDGVLYRMRKESPPGREIKTVDIAKEIIQRACRQKKIRQPGDSDLERIAKEVETAFVETELESMALMPDARETLEEIKRRGKKIVLVSNLEEDKKHVSRYLLRLGILHYFDKIHVSSDFGYAKSIHSDKFYKKMLADAPDPKTKKSVNPRNVIHIGDNFRNDVEGAALADIRGIHFDEDKVQKDKRREERKGSLVELQGKDLLEQRKKMFREELKVERIPEAERENLQKLSERMYELGRDYYAPAAMGLAVDCLRSLQKNPDQLNLCAGRDALILFILQKKLLRECSSAFPGIDHKRIQYVPLSRKLIGSRRSIVKDWQLEMKEKHPEINTYDEDRIRRLLKSAGMEKYRTINIIDHSLAGTTQDKLEELYPGKDIRGTYLVSKTRGTEVKKKTGYFTGLNITNDIKRTDLYNGSGFGDRYRKMADPIDYVWLVEFFFNGIQISSEYFTGEEGKTRPKTNQRKLGETLKERREKVLRLAALQGMIDAVKLHGEAIVRESDTDRIARIDKFYHWLEKIVPKEEREKNPTDDALFKILFTRNEGVINIAPPDGGKVVRKEAVNPSTGSQEKRLDKIHRRGNYVPLDLSVREKGKGDAAGGYCNEKKYEKDDPRLGEIKSPNGYLIGVGAGTIWSLMQYFEKPDDLKGIIAFDIDPAVILFGLTVVELAKKGMDRNEMIFYLFGGTMSKKIGIDDKTLARSESDYLTIARSVMEKQENPELRKKFAETLLPPKKLATFDPELREAAVGGFVLFDRNKRRDRYFHSKGKRRVRLQASRKRLNIAHVLYSQWDKIVALAKQGKISFLHASFKDEKALKTIQEAIPDIGSLKNIIYTSNAVGSRYVPNAEELDRVCNAGKKSVYVSTTRREPDDYHLKASKEPPKLE